MPVPRRRRNAGSNLPRHPMTLHVDPAARGADRSGIAGAGRCALARERTDPRRSRSPVRPAAALASGRSARSPSGAMPVAAPRPAPSPTGGPARKRARAMLDARLPSPAPGGARLEDKGASSSPCTTGKRPQLEGALSWMLELQLVRRPGRRIRSASRVPASSSSSQRSEPRPARSPLSPPSRRSPAARWSSSATT